MESLKSAKDVPVRGLRNSGRNLCFLNVVLQGLFSLLPFRCFLAHAASLWPLRACPVLMALYVTRINALLAIADLL